MPRSILPAPPQGRSISQAATTSAIAWRIYGFTGLRATVKSAGRLHAFCGFTDFALRQAQAAGVAAPVRFVVSIDGKTVVERDVARAAGWNDIPLPSGAAPDVRVRIQISAGADSWSHFVFDLWSD